MRRRGVTVRDFRSLTARVPLRDQRSLLSEGSATKYRGSSHCGKVAFEVEGDIDSGMALRPAVPPASMLRA